MHVIQRGNNRSACFQREVDYAVYLRLLAEGRSAGPCLVHAYVLMTNHVHLLVTGETEDAVSRMMKRVGESYVRYFNRAYERSGTLWEGRFRSSIVDSEHYLLTCYRYIESNPVRAGMVPSPGEYRWSSHRANAHGSDDDIVTPHDAYLAIGSPDTRLQSYRRLFESAEDPDDLRDIRAALNGGFALGTPDFLMDLERRAGRRVERMTKGRIRVSSAAAVPDDDNSGLSPVV
jgi:REP-associated tyrosine transposase